MPAPAILLKPGEEKKEYEFQSHNLGTKAISIDGRVFRYSKMGATVGVAGNVYQAAVPVANHLGAVCDVARDVGATQISATLGATAASIDDYAEGTAHVNKAGGLGHTYLIHRAWRPGDGHAAVASAGILTANLELGDAVKVALTTTSEITFAMNKYKDLVIQATALTSCSVGVAPHAVTAAYFHWLQTGGPCAVLTDGTVVIHQHVRASDGTAGSVEALDRDGTDEDEQEIGVVMRVNITAEYSLIDLSLDRG